MRVGKSKRLRRRARLARQRARLAHFWLAMESLTGPCPICRMDESSPEMRAIMRRVLRAAV